MLCYDRRFKSPTSSHVLNMFIEIRRLQNSGNAVELKGVYEDSNSVYIVMEECLGGDLEQLMDVCIELCCLKALVVSLRPYLRLCEKHVHLPFRY